MEAYEETKKKIHRLSKEIFDIENSFDSSMRGVILDEVITNYVGLRGEKFCSMFDFIMENQKTDYQTYGDIDTSVTKINVKGKRKEEDDDYNYYYHAMFLNDIFCGNMFVILKIVEELKDHKNIKTTEFRVTKVSKEVKYVDLTNLGYGDVRDNNYVVTFQSFKSRPIEVKDRRGMADFYHRYKEAEYAITQPYLELSNPES